MNAEEKAAEPSLEHAGSASPGTCSDRPAEYVSPRVVVSPAVGSAAPAVYTATTTSVAGP